MKILMVNNRLKVYGGEGTYMTSVGDELIRQGHDVQFFGLRDSDNLHGNKFDIYAKKSMNPFKLIKNRYNQKQFAKILDAFKPDIIHLNLIYFTLTPSILVEAKKRNIPVIQTIHDGKMVCPSYQLYIYNENKSCLECVGGDFKKCLRHRCHKGSLIYSYLAYKEAVYNRKHNYYDLIDCFVFPSEFMRNIHLEYGLDSNKTCVIRNFTRINKRTDLDDKTEKYALFFGRVETIKGVELVAEAAKLLPEIPFKIVGAGNRIDVFDNLKNVQLLGFKNESDLESIISHASFSMFPSVCYENCPMSIQESIALGTPVIGSNIGGIPELILSEKTGLIFEPGNLESFVECIKKLFYDSVLLHSMSVNCVKTSEVFTCKDYTKHLVQHYEKLLKNN